MESQQCISENSDAVLRNNIKLEIGRIPWKELVRFFAGGAALFISSELKLEDAAFQIVKDNTSVVEQWMLSGRVARVTDEQAKAWFETKAIVSAIVIKPFVLVQETGTMQ